MSLPKITADQVIREAGVVTETAKRVLVPDEKLLHDRGYHEYSRIMSNFRNKIEEAYSQLVEELM